MSLNITFTAKDELVIDWNWLMQHLSTKERIMAGRFALLEEGVIDDLVSCIIKGETDDYQWNWGDHLHRIRIKLLPLLPVFQQNLIEALCNDLKSTDENRQELLKKCWKLEDERDSLINLVKRLEAEIQNLKSSNTEGDPDEQTQSGAEGSASNNQAT